MQIAKTHTTIRLMLCLLCALTVLTGCARRAYLDPTNTKAPADPILIGPDDGEPAAETLTGFSYEFGSFHGGMWEYNITKETDAYLFTARGLNGVDLDVQAYVDQNVLDEIDKVITENGIAAWSGFSKRDTDILDGYGFTLTAEYAKGSITANGYEAYPKNYSQGHAALAACLLKIANTAPPAEPTGVEDVVRIDVTFHDSLGTYAMRARQAEKDTNAFMQYAGFILEQYGQFKGGSSAGSDGGASLTITIRTDTLDYTVSINQERNPDAYAKILEQSLLIDGQQANYLSSEEFQTEVYKKQFIYPTAWLYDADGLGAVIVNMPEQTVTINGEVIPASREDMLAFYEFVSAFPAGYGLFDHELFSDYLESGQSMEGVFEQCIADGNTWMVGRGHMRDAFFLYGGKGNAPAGFAKAAAAFQALLEKVLV